MQSSGNLARSAGTQTIRSATAGTNPDHFAFPGITKTSAGHLLASYRVGTEHNVESAAYHVCVKSTDGGITWGAETTLYDPVGLDPRDTALTTLANGTIVAVFFNHNGVNYQSGIIRSTDSGATWGAPVLMTSSLIPGNHAISGPVIQLANGDLLATIYGKLSGGTNESIVVMKSTNGGTTWADLAVVVNGDTAGTSTYEANLVLLNNGNVYCAIRTASEKMAWATSTNSGATWSAMTVSPSYQSAGRPAISAISSGGLVWSSRVDGVHFYRTSWDNGITWAAQATIESGGFRGAYTQAVQTAPNVLALVSSMEFPDSGRATLKLVYLYDTNLADPLP